MNKKLIRITTVPASLGGLLNGQLKFMSKYYTVLGVSSKGTKNQLLKVEENEGVRTYSVEMTRKITPIKDLLAVFQLYKLFKKEKPFIVHSHTPKAGTLAMIAAKFSKVPHRLHTIAGLPLLEATGLKRKLLNAVETITYKCATKIYPNSFGLKNIIIDEGFTKPNKLKVIANGSSNGIDTRIFNPNEYNNEIENNTLKEKLNITKQDFIFVFAGRLVSDKGINELMLAYNQISNTYKHVKLLLVGTYENELDPLLPESLKIIENNKSIISTGWVTDVRPYFSISNALVFPSYREGFPNVVMQAGAMELPAIVTNINGCNEIIEHHKTGIIIPVKQVDALYEAMSYIIENPTESKKMGQRSRAYIAKHFERQVVWDALLEEYNSLN